MSIIYPFTGLRYNPQKIDSLSKVIAPPYDVIGSEEQEQLYQASSYNIIRLEYSKETSEDTWENNRYTRAASDLHRWLEERILIQEDQPVFYWYEQQFSWEENNYCRDGLIATLKTEPYESNSVIPHEETLSKPKEDRLQLLRHGKTNFSPIFGLYPDRENKIENRCSFMKNYKPEIDFYDSNHQRHRLWLIKDPSLQKEIQSIFEPFTVFIADGHHRYETALKFSQEMAASGKTGYDHVLAVLVNLYSPGLLILPTHRVLYHVPQLDMPDFIGSLKNEFELEEWGNPQELYLNKFLEYLQQKGQDCFAFGMATPENVYLCKQYNNSRASEKLDVTWLQEKVLEEKIGLTQDSIKSGQNLLYTRSAREALDLVVKGQAQVSFLLNPPGINQTIQMAQTSDRLPQKSTYFFPKLISGLVLNKLD